jgi:hypothetical protein
VTVCANGAQPGFVAQEAGRGSVEAAAIGSAGWVHRGRLRGAMANAPRPISEGDWITVVTNVTGTFTGEMTLLDGIAIAPTGNAFDPQGQGRPPSDLEVGRTNKWDGDRPVCKSAFWDPALRVHQLGSSDSKEKCQSKEKCRRAREPADHAQITNGAWAVMGTLLVRVAPRQPRRSPWRHSGSSTSRGHLPCWR